jgi:hypothetical protein
MQGRTTLRLGQTRIPVSSSVLTTACGLFANNPSLCATEYCVQTAVSVDLFREFVGAIEGASIHVTSNNNVALFDLSTEFGFDRLLSAVAVFRCSNESKPQSNDRLRQLEDRSAAQDRDIAVLRREVALLRSSEQRLLEAVDRLGIVERELSRLKGDFGGLSAAVEAAVPSMDNLKAGLGGRRMRMFSKLWLLEIRKIVGGGYV